MRSYARPATLAEALQCLAAQPCCLLAGGTDLYPKAGRALEGAVLDLTGIATLRGIGQGQNGAGLRIGACTSWSEIADSDLPAALYALQQAARQVGGRQIQNLGTIGGNLCNASPAADGVAPLLVLEAEVELARLDPQSGGISLRHVPLAQFLRGPRLIDLAQGEILTAIHVPEVALKGQSAFLKLGARAYLVISIAMVAVRLELNQGRITAVALAVGACSATARRLPAQEARLLGLPAREALAALDPQVIASALAPIDDLRATAEYRSEAAIELLRRALSVLILPAGREAA